MRQASLNALAAQESWTLKRRDELIDICQQFSQQQSHSSLTPSLYKLKRMMSLEGMRGDEPVIPIIIYESLKRQASQQEIERCAEHFHIIDPEFRETFAIGISLISADLCRNLEQASSTILHFHVTEAQAMGKLLELPEVFRGEQWAIRLRPFLSPDNQIAIESRLEGLHPSEWSEPSQRLLSSFAYYLKLSFDQGIMPSQVSAKPGMSRITKTLVTHLLDSDQMIYKANQPLVRMLNGWIRQNILSLGQTKHPFQAADRVRHLCPGLLNDPRNFPESWKKTLLVNSDDCGLGR